LRDLPAAVPPAAPGRRSSCGTAQLIVDGPGLVTFEGQAVSKFDAFPHGVGDTVLLQAQVGWVGGEVPVPIEVELLHTARNDEGVKSTWVYRRLPGSRA
jgi:hypothetical protein